MSSIHTLLIGITASLLAGCLSPSLAEGLPIRSLAKAAFSGIQDPKQEVIKDKSDWEKAWASHQATAKAGPPRPEVDFSKEMVILVAMGRQNSGGYAIQVSSVKPAGDKLEISIARSTPPSGAMTIQALTAPIHIVAVPRNDLKPEFLDVKPPARRKR